MRKTEFFTLFISWFLLGIVQMISWDLSAIELVVRTKYLVAHIANDKNLKSFTVQQLECSHTRASATATASG